MSENYRDICEIDEESSGTGTGDGSDNLEGESLAPSTPFDFNGDLGIIGNPNPIDNLRNPNSNLAENISSPELEITRGNLTSGSRRIIMIPQQYVYNFPTSNIHGLGLVGLRGLNLDSILRQIQTSLPLVPSSNPADYVTAGENFESVSTVVGKQDTLRFLSGKVFYSRTSSFRRDGEAFLDGTYVGSELALVTKDQISNHGPEGSYRDIIAETYGGNRVRAYRYLDAKIFFYNHGEIEIQRKAPNPRHGPVGIFDGVDLTISIGTLYTQSNLSFSLARENNPVTTDEMEDYIESFVPGEDKIFEGGPAVFDAAFFKPELSFMNLPPAIYGDIKVNFPKESQLAVYEMDSILEFANNDYYQVRSETRATKRNLYSTLLSDAPTALEIFKEPGEDGAPIPTGRPTNKEQCNVVEKYSSHRVFLIQQANSQLDEFVEDDSQNLDLGRPTILETMSPLSVKIEFANPGYVDPEDPRKIKRIPKLFVDHGLDSYFLTFLDKGFSDEDFPNNRLRPPTQRPLFDSLYALDIEQDLLDETLNEDDFYSQSNDQNDYMSPNEKLLLNYRPRVYHDVFDKMWYFFTLLDDPAVVGPHEPATAMRGLFGNLLEFPLLFENSDEYIDEEIGPEHKTISLTSNDWALKQWHERLSSSFADLKFAISDLLFGEFDDLASHFPTKIENLFGIQSPHHPDTAVKSVPIAYRVEKVNSFTGKVLKEFYFFNNSDLQTIKFYDSEASPSDVFRYNIYSVNFVVDYVYSYSETLAGHDSRISLDGTSDIRLCGRQLTNSDSLEWPDAGRGVLDRAGGLDLGAIPTVQTKVKIKPSFKIIESPFFSKEVSVFDAPPLPPNVSLDKIERNENGEQEFRIRFLPQVGTRFEAPIKIVESDQETIDKMRADQVLTLPAEIDPNFIQYTSDTLVQEFEVFVLSEPPLGYESFRESDSYSFSANAPFFTFPAPINEPRYMIFRSKDKAGISNPTQIYKFLFSSYGDGEFYEFDLYEPESEVLRQPLEMGCERLLSIEPSLEQAIFNFFQTDGNDARSVRSLLENPPSSIVSTTLGHATPGSEIWDKKFKVRLISKNTGRAIDFNIEFLLEKLDKTVSEESDIIRNNLERRECIDPVESKNARINSMINGSNQKLKEELSAPSSQSEVQRIVNPGDINYD